MRQYHKTVCRADLRVDDSRINAQARVCHQNDIAVAAYFQMAGPDIGRLIQQECPAA